MKLIGKIIKTLPKVVEKPFEGIIETNDADPQILKIISDTPFPSVGKTVEIEVKLIGRVWSGVNSSGELFEQYFTGIKSISICEKP